MYSVDRDWVRSTRRQCSDVNVFLYLCFPDLALLHFLSLELRSSSRVSHSGGALLVARTRSYLRLWSCDFFATMSFSPL